MECVISFYKMVKKCMQQLLLSSQYLFSTIKEYVIFYEIQQCGSLHACLIFLVVKIDIENITNEIVALILATFDGKIIYMAHIWNTKHILQNYNVKTTSHMWK
jgi:hypothetical protein